MNFKEMSKAKKIICGICIFIMALSLFNIIWCFANLRIGHHSDETWSYGFANSLYDPYIYCKINDDIYLSDATDQNIGEWVSGKTFFDYIVVNRGEEFRYDSVYSNKSGDISGPLYEFILHTICSFFPETFSWWYAFSINIVCYILIVVLVIFIGNELCNELLVGCLAASVYSLTIGCINNIVYLRMYALFTVFLLWYLYLGIKLIKKNFKHCLFEYIKLFVCIIAGSFSHFYFLVLAFLFTLFTCFVLLLKKRIKEAFLFGGCELVSVGIFFVMYPSSLGRLTSVGSFYTNSLTYPYYLKLKIVLDVFSVETFGFHWLITKTNCLYLLGIIVFLSILVVLISFLFRHEELFKMVKNLAKRKLISFFQMLPGKIKGYFENISYINFILISTIFAFIFIVAKVSAVETMGETSDRYLFAIMPVFSIWLISICRRIASCFCHKYRPVFCGIISCLFIFCLIYQNLFYEKTYLFSNDNSDYLETITENANVIIASRYSWRLEWYANILMNSDNVLFISPSKLSDYKEAISDIPSDNPIILICEADAFGIENEKLASGIPFDIFSVLAIKNEVMLDEFITDLKSTNSRYSDLTLDNEIISFVGQSYVYK